MEQIDLPLSKLTFDQKLNLLESIWDDLTRNEKKLESPVWHKEVLEDREKALLAGAVEVRDWEKAKERIKNNVK